MKIRNLILVLSVVLAAAGGCQKVESGHAGVRTVWGKAESEAVRPGLAWFNPVSTVIVDYDVRKRITKYKMETYTKDVQQASLCVAFNHAIVPDKVVELHVRYGTDYEQKILDPIVIGAVKDVIGNWEAAELVIEREKATAQIAAKIAKATEPTPVTVSDVNLLNIDFSDIFEKSIEEKQVCAQKALAAKNRTVQIEEEAKQKIIIAKSEAEALRIRGEALKANRGLVLLEAIQKWDGKAPGYLSVGGVASPGALIDLKNAAL